jgi:hypothetical protein
MVGVTAAVIGSPKYSVSHADPMFDLIEAHREANAAMNASYSEQSRLEEELPNDLTQSKFSAWETTIVETDDPRWIANQRNVHMACEADTETALALIQEPPATVEGALLCCNMWQRSNVNTSFPMASMKMVMATREAGLSSFTRI